MTDFGGFLGLAEHVKLGIYAKNAVKVQEHIVKKLMRDNKNTVYGKAHNFKDVHSVADCQAKVPLSRYKDYEKYIDRMVETGERNLITRYRTDTPSPPAASASRSSFPSPQGRCGTASASASRLPSAAPSSGSTRTASVCLLRKAC